MTKPAHDAAQMWVHHEAEDCATRFNVSDFRFGNAGVHEGNARPELAMEGTNEHRLHCPQCGAPDLRRAHPVIIESDAMGCSQCGAVLRANHRVVVVGIGVWADAVLLVKRAIEPRLGFWTLPGGYVEEGELMPEAMEREFTEEAGAHIGGPRLVALYEMPQLNQLFGVYVARLASASVFAGLEVSEVRLFPFRELPLEELAFPTDEWVLRRQSHVADENFDRLGLGHFYWRNDGKIRFRRPALAGCGDEVEQ